MITLLDMSHTLDSIARADSLNEVQMELAQVVQKLTTTPMKELALDAVDSGVKFGLHSLDC